MLERVLRLDAGQPDPARVQLPAVPGGVLGMQVTMGVDLAYRTTDCSVLRLLVGHQQDLAFRALRLHAVAAPLNFEGRADPTSRVARVEVWSLRRERLSEMAWTPDELLASVPPLSAGLDAIRRGAAEQAA